MDRAALLNYAAMKIIRPLTLLCLVLWLVPAPAQELSLELGSASVRVEVAATPQDRERGLMGRARLCNDCGMLFVFDHADRLAFWMKDTPLPLSIAFIAADGRILNIEDMQPYTTSRHYARGDALYALEMNRGWFGEHGIAPGDRIRGLPSGAH